MPQTLPTGTVTFMFTDIAGSTRLLNDIGEERYAEELSRHRVVLRTAFSRHDGVEVSTEGDSFFVVFPTATQALHAATEGLEALRTGLIRVRIGIHTGTPLLADNDYVGMDVHRASRIANAGSGGQVLVSATAAALADPNRFELVDLGDHRLKDLAKPERIFQLGTGSFPPVKSLSASNLPVPAAPFLGRRIELGEVTSLVRDPTVRVVTLTGPGGTGKTRLALEAARMCSDAFPAGSWWVPLASLSDPKHATSTLAAVLGVEERPEEDLSSEVAARLAAGASLVLFDNAEHLLPAFAHELAPLIRDAGTSTFLITSRARLQLGQEHEFAVPAMSAEDAESFVLSKARAVGVDVAPSPALTVLCERLDRLPLAMQLAAARLRMFSVEQLTERLGNVLDLSGDRDADPRQKTLRQTIGWSYSLLNPSEQQALCRLAVFASGATIDAIEEVTSAEPETVGALLDQSLIRRRDGRSGPRFWMLETIRQFALELLVDAGEEDEIRGRHAAYFRALAERAGLGLDRARADWLDVLDADLENLRSALSWSLDRGDRDTARAVVGSLGVYWVDRGLLSEMRSWVERSLEGDREGDPAHTLVLMRRSQIAYLQGEYDLARESGEQALAQARAFGDAPDTARAMLYLAAALEAHGSLEEGWALEAEALEMARGLRNSHPRILLVALINLGYTSISRGKYEHAVRDLEEAVALGLELDEVADAAAARCNLALALLNLDRIDEAGRMAALATVSAIDCSDQLLGTDCLEVLAAVEAARGDHRVAALVLGAAEALRLSIGYELEPAERALHERTLARVAITSPTATALLQDGADLSLEEAFALVGRDFLD
jgi:predicted ATPase/class 3 adenylate cyclase